MKITNTILLLLTFSATLYSQNLDCKDFKEGSFFMESNMNGVELRFEMSRTGNTQTEYYGIDEEMHLKLEWIDNCTYRMTNDDTKNQLDDFSKFLNENGGIYVTKKYIENNCFYYTSNFKMPNDKVVTIDGRICKEVI